MVCILLPDPSVVTSASDYLTSDQKKGTSAMDLRSFVTNFNLEDLMDFDEDILSVSASATTYSEPEQGDAVELPLSVPSDTIFLDSPASESGYSSGPKEDAVELIWLDDSVDEEVQMICEVPGEVQVICEVPNREVQIICEVPNQRTEALGSEDTIPLYSPISEACDSPDPFDSMEMGAVDDNATDFPDISDERSIAAAAAAAVDQAIDCLEGEYALEKALEALKETRMRAPSFDEYIEDLAAIRHREGKLLEKWGDERSGDIWGVICCGEYIPYYKQECPVCSEYCWDF